MKAQVVPAHIVYADTCLVAGSVSDQTPFGIQSCAWNTSAREPHVYLVGDSTAAQYSEALIGATDTVGSPLNVRTADACFFVGAAVYVDGVRSSGCASYVEATVAWLTHKAPGIVVLSSAWDVVIDGPFATLERGRDTAARATTADQKRHVVVSSLTEIIQRLREAGHQVIIVLPAPHFVGDLREADTFAEGSEDVWRPSACPNVKALFNTRDCGATRPETEVHAEQVIIDEALRGIAEATGSTTVDLRAHYCSAGVCRTNVGDRWMFRDGYHITVAESEALAPTFAEPLRQTARMM
jgi:hypothetical protein